MNKQVVTMVNSIESIKRVAQTLGIACETCSKLNKRNSYCRQNGGLMRKDEFCSNWNKSK